jgi:hypothetical protein
MDADIPQHAVGIYQMCGRHTPLRQVEAFFCQLAGGPEVCSH